MCYAEWIKSFCKSAYASVCVCVLLCDSWPRGQLPDCAFVPLPIQHNPNPSTAAAQHNTITTNSHWWPPSLHFSKATLTAAEWSDIEWKLFHTLPKTSSYFCSIADMLKPKIDRGLFPPAIAFTTNLCNDIVSS